MRYALMHACGGPAVFLDHKPTPGEVATANGVSNLNGTQALHGSRVCCGTCGEQLLSLNANNVVGVIELIIPLLLPSLNAMGGAGRGHWTAWQKDKKLWTNWVLVAKLNQAKLYGQPKIERARVEIDRYCVQDVKDEDNLHAGRKWLMDALVGHGILKDDSREHVTVETRQIRCKRADPPRTVVRIYPLPQISSR